MEREPTVTIERWRNVYSVAADFPAPEELRLRLDRMVEREVVDACRRRLAPLLDASDPSVWLIREIHVDLAVDAGENVAQQAGAAWGEQLALEVSRVLGGATGGGSVVRFANRAAYVAQWARDMAAGCAWEQWYYAEFASLRSLAQSAAIVEGILREPGEAKPILRLLHGWRSLEAVLAALTPADARRLYEGLLPRSLLRAAEPGRWASRLLALWNAVALSTSGDTGRDALRLYAAAQAEWAEPAESDAAGLRFAIDGLLELRRMVSALHSSKMAGRFLQAAVAQQYEEAREILRACGIAADESAIEFVNRTSGGDLTWANFAAAVVRPSAAAEAYRDESFLSELGGVFLLGTAFRDLGISDAMRSAAQSCEEPQRAEAALRHLLAVRCVGKARASLAIGDAAMLLFSNADGKTPLSEMAEMLAAADEAAAMRVVAETMQARGDEDPAEGALDEHLDYFEIGRVFPELELDAERERAWSRMAAAVLRNFARRLPGFGRSSPEYLFQNFLAGTSSVRRAAGRIEVRLPQSPLVVVLRMAGAYRTLTLPWREGVEICLLAPGG